MGQGAEPGAALHADGTSPCLLLSYGMRYVAKILRTSLAEKFPKAPEEEIDKVSWGWRAMWLGGLQPRACVEGHGPSTEGQVPLT